MLQGFSWNRAHGLRACRGVGDEGVQSGDELEVPFGFGVPASGGGVLGEEGDCVALAGEGGQVLGLGPEAGAVFADVGLAAGALGRGA